MLPDDRPLTLAVLRAAYPAPSFRVSEYRYPPGAAISGRARAATWFVLAGACTIHHGTEVIAVEAGQVAEVGAGAYTLTVLGGAELRVVIVWDLRDLIGGGVAATAEAIMERFRLDSTAPVAAERFRRASASKRREAACVACEHAVAAVGLTAPDTSEALTVLRGAAPADASLHGRLESLAAGFDDAYFRLDESGGDAQKHQARHCFAKARAASALAFAVTDDDTRLHEAIYEAICALDEPGELVRLVERVLGDISTVRLVDIVANLGAHDPALTIYAVAPWTCDSAALAAREPADGGVPPEARAVGATYLIGVFIAQEFLDGWRVAEKRSTSPSEECERLIHYAICDA